MERVCEAAASQACAASSVAPRAVCKQPIIIRRRSFEIFFRLSC